MSRGLGVGNTIIVSEDEARACPCMKIPKLICYKAGHASPHALNARFGRTRDTREPRRGVISVNPLPKSRDGFERG